MGFFPKGIKTGNEQDAPEYRPKRYPANPSYI